MKDKKLKKQYDNNIPEIFLRGANSYERSTDDQFWHLVKSLNLPEKLSILDLGSGPGRDLKFAQENFDTTVLAGVDTSKEMCKLAKKTISGADIRLESFLNTSFKDNSFDLVLSRYALQTHKNPDDCWKEITRLLKPGGFGVCLITHPISNYEKKSSNYFNQEEIKGVIFNQIQITEPSHTFQDWLSKLFFSNFELLALEEGKQNGERKYPSYFILVFKKK